ncbi:hypothetical protein GCM10017708_31320 [Arthrobacter citreus]
MSSPTPSSGSHRKHAAVWAGLTIGLSVILLALLMLFISPSLLSGPRDLALGVVGPQDRAESVAKTLEDQSPGAFVVQSYESADDLEQGIRDRDIVGGFDFTDPDMTVYVASASSTAVSGTVSNVGATMAGSMGQTAETVDVVPLPRETRPAWASGAWPFRWSLAALCRPWRSAPCCPDSAGGSSPDLPAFRWLAGSSSPRS